MFFYKTWYSGRMVCLYKLGFFSSRCDAVATPNSLHTVFHLFDYEDFKTFLTFNIGFAKNTIGKHIKNLKRF
jgi:hypothetical protein